mmetsp:Transcript_4619/g.8465  ORF Transcript_4619/g.8465 Transcript_4619/m.8465 type:complete len:109 (+) Transcript_4619:6-332(+)
MFPEVSSHSSSLIPSLAHKCGTLGIPFRARASEVEFQMPSSTIHWRPNESSLSRESFNAIVNRQKIDVTVTMQENAKMSKKVMQEHGTRVPVCVESSRTETPMETPHK